MLQLNALISANGNAVRALGSEACTLELQSLQELNVRCFGRFCPVRGMLHLDCTCVDYELAQGWIWAANAQLKMRSAPIKCKPFIPSACQSGPKDDGPPLVWVQSNDACLQPLLRTGALSGQRAHHEEVDDIPLSAGYNVDYMRSFLSLHDQHSIISQSYAPHDHRQCIASCTCTNTVVSEEQDLMCFHLIYSNVVMGD
jgi:hypothetical protein